MKKHRGLKAGVLTGVLLLLLGVLYGRWERAAHMCTPNEMIEKYKQKQNRLLQRTQYGIGVRDSFSYEFAYDFSGDSVTEWNGIITVHTERHCQEESRLTTSVKVKPAEKGCRVEVSPIEQALASKSDRQLERSWGSAPVYYLAIRYDQRAERKRKLDQPVIVPFILKSPCGVPNLEGEADEGGVFRLRWSPVEGAKEYRIYNYFRTGGGESAGGALSGYHDGTLICEKSVKGTVYEGFSGAEENRVLIHSYKDGCEIVFGENYGVQGEYYVTAVVDGKESIMSNGVSTEDCRLPVKIAEKQDILYKRYGKVENLPLTVPVENTDGTVEDRNVLYTLYETEDMRGERQIQYRYSIEGTCLKGYVVMTAGGDAKYPETVGTPSLAGRMEPVDKLDKVPQVKSPRTGKEKREVAVPQTDYYIKAENAAEEWLALNLIAGEDEIYMGDFPELTEPDHLRDIFYHMYYQNPYVFGIAAFACDYERLTLHIEYLYSAKERARMREEMTEKAGQILEDVGLSGAEAENWSTEEKVRILYEWLENHTSYDRQAYERSAKNQHRKEGEDYEYAHNAWGIFIKCRGMCQGYSDAFLLLCHMAGVEAVAVTGYINQSIPHVWNAVCLEGSWYYMDVTNNAKNTGASPCLYLAGEKQAKEKNYVRVAGGMEKDEDAIIISQQKFHSK